MKGESDALLALSPMAHWRALLSQSPAFWGLCFYFMIEYVRPQSIWPAIDVLPWGQASLLFTFGAALLVERPRKRPVTPLDIGVTAFTAVVLASLVTSQYPSWGMEGMSVFINWLLVYYLTVRLVNTPKRFLIFFLLFLLWSLKMSQHGTRSLIARGFTFQDWGATGGPGWFHNSGEFAIQMCVFLPMSLHFILGMKHRWPRWKTLGLTALLAGTAVIALISSSSRGGQLGGAAVLLFMVLFQSKYRWKKLFWVALVLPIGWILTPPEQQARFMEMGEDHTSQTRFTYWTDGLEIMSQYPILGIGYESWGPYYTRNYNPDGQLPHNIFIEAGAELGYLGLGAFLVLIALTFTMNARTRRLATTCPEWGAFLRSTAYGLDAALVGYLVSGFFVTVLFYPYFWVNLSFTAALYLVTRQQAVKTRRGRWPLRPPMVQTVSQRR
ncbi:MAG: O-antigen ligase family protein [Dehalococcoidia bacterium]